MQQTQFHTYREAQTWLKNKSWPKAVIMTGSELYLQTKLLSAVKQEMLSPGAESFDLIHFDGKGNIRAEDLASVENGVKTMPFLSQRKVVIVENSGLFTKTSAAIEKKRAQFIDMLSSLDEQSCLILWEEEIDKKHRKFLRQVSESAQLLEIGEQADRDLARWLQALAKRKGKQMLSAACEALIIRCDKDMSQLEQELNKLLLYAEYTEASTIDLEMVDEVARPDLSGNVFKLVDAVMGGNCSEALSFVERLRLQGEDIPRLRFMFMRHLKQLILAGELRTVDIILQEMKVHPFVARKLAEQAARLSVKRLEQLYHSGVELERKCKSGELEEKVGFEVLLIYAATIFNVKNRGGR